MRNLVEKYFQADRAAIKKSGHDLVELEGKALDFILLDARAGFNDLGGLAIADLSHAAVIFGTQSHQSWAGLTHVVRRIARPLAPEQLPLLLIHAMAPPLTTPGREQELTEFRDRAYTVAAERRLSQNEATLSGDKLLHPYDLQGSLMETSEDRIRELAQEEYPCLEALKSSLKGMRFPIETSKINLKLK